MPILQNFSGQVKTKSILLQNKMGEILLRDNFKVANSKVEQAEIFRGDGNTERLRTVAKFSSRLGDAEHM